MADDGEFTMPLGRDQLRIGRRIGNWLRNELRYNFADCAQLQEIQIRFTCWHKGKTTMAISGASQIYSSLAAQSQSS